MKNPQTTPLSQQIVSRLREGGPVRKSQNAIANLIAACDLLEKQNIEICVAVVGKICNGKPGGPATQSIRNNADYKSYVAARRTEQVILPTRRKDEVARPFRTGDVNIDAYLQTLEFELAKTKSELKSLRQAIPRLGQYDLNAAIERGHLVICGATPESLPAMAREAVKALLDQEVLSRVGLVLMKTGQIIAPELNDAVLLTKPQVDALRVVVEGGSQEDRRGE